MTLDLSRQPGNEVGTTSSLKCAEGTVAPHVDSVCQVFTTSSFPRTLGTLGLEEGQATLKPLP